MYGIINRVVIVMYTILSSLPVVGVSSCVMYIHLPLSSCYCKSLYFDFHEFREEQTNTNWWFTSMQMLGSIPASHIFLKFLFVDSLKLKTAKLLDFQNH